MTETADDMSQPAPDAENGADSPQTDEAHDPAVESDPDAESGRGPDDDGVHRLHRGRDEGPESRPRRDSGPEDWANLHRMLDVPLSLTVELGRTEMPLSEVLNLDAGSVITIDRMPGEPIGLFINGRLFARGEVVVIHETFGFRITQLVDDAAATIETVRNGE